jgi:hypothetical protein
MWTTIRKPFYNLYRRWFGTYTLDDPRIVQREAPYTFFLPSQREIDSVRPDDVVKLIFRSEPEGSDYGAERMWVIVKEVRPDGLIGVVDNHPFDMPQLKAGATVRFQPYNIISIKLYGHPEDEEPEQKSYWDRCMVDKCVTEDKIPVYYLYREEPDLDQEGDEYPDSGWRIRGDYRDISNEELDARKAEYVAIGRVLNADDSWLHLIDAPIGSAFMRNFETGEYEPCERGADDDND